MNQQTRMFLFIDFLFDILVERIITNQGFYLLDLDNTSPTFASAIQILVHSIIHYINPKVEKNIENLRGEQNLPS